MQLATRPWITAGVALTTAGAITLSPLPPSLPQVRVPAIQLTTGFDLITPWVDTVNSASANITGLFDGFFDAPAATLQQIAVNQFDYLDELIGGTGNIGNVLTQMGDNLQDVWQTFLLAGAPADIVSATIPHTLEAYHAYVYSLIPLVLQLYLGITDPDTIAEINSVMDFISSPLSGVLIGAVGPVVSPVVELGNDVQDITAALSGSSPDFVAALNDLIDIPANLTNAFLNGSTLDLTGLVSLLAQQGLLPAGIDVTYLGVAFGGLLTAGFTGGTYPADPTPTGIGGSIFNSIAFTLDKPLAVGLGGVPVGPIGAMENLGQIFAEALGWSGTGNPLSELTFPVLPTAAADSAAAVSTDLSALFGGLSTDFSALVSGLSTDLGALFGGSLAADIPNVLLSAFGL